MGRCANPGFGVLGVGQAQSGSRIVFVTADTVLFDTYRRWYANLSLDDEAYLQPFCLRRLRQYAPSFNLIDSGLVQGRAIGNYSRISTTSWN